MKPKIVLVEIHISDHNLKHEYQKTIYVQCLLKIIPINYITKPILISLMRKNFTENMIVH